MSPHKDDHPMDELEAMDKLQLDVNRTIRETLPVKPAEEMDDEVGTPKDPEIPDASQTMFDFEALVTDIDEHWEDELLDL